MSSAGVEAVGAGRYRLTGELTFATVPQLWRERGTLFGQTGGALTVDLGAVRRADSAGVALLIEFVRAARAADRPITFHDVPEQILAIIRVSGLESFLLVSS